MHGDFIADEDACPQQAELSQKGKKPPGAQNNTQQTTRRKFRGMPHPVLDAETDTDTAAFPIFLSSMLYHQK